MDSKRGWVAAWTVVVSSLLCAGTWAQYGAPANGDWPHYSGDQGSTRYSPLSEINANNFKRLKIAWRWESADKDLSSLPFKPFHFRVTPVVVDGIAYVSTGLSQVAAIDVATGETLWVHNPESYKRGPMTHGSMNHRAPKSIGQCATPGRVFRGKRLPGHMGDKNVTARNLQVVRVDAENHVLLVRGAVPGAMNAEVLVRKTTKGVRVPKYKAS